MEQHHRQVQAEVAKANLLLVRQHRETRALVAQAPAYGGGAGCSAQNKRLTKKQANAVSVFKAEHRADVRLAINRIDRLLRQNSVLLKREIDEQ